MKLKLIEFNWLKYKYIKKQNLHCIISFESTLIFNFLNDCLYSWILIILILFLLYNKMIYKLVYK